MAIEMLEDAGDTTQTIRELTQANLAVAEQLRAARAPGPLPNVPTPQAHLDIAARMQTASQPAPKAPRIDPSALKIESGIELPELEPVFKRSAWPELLAKMAVGDSIFIEGGTIAKYAYVRAIAKKQDITVTFRKSQHGVRMWRIATPVVDDDGL